MGSKGNTKRGIWFRATSLLLEEADLQVCSEAKSATRIYTWTRTLVTNELTSENWKHCQAAKRNARSLSSWAEYRWCPCPSIYSTSMLIFSEGKSILTRNILFCDGRRKAMFDTVTVSYLVRNALSKYLDTSLGPYNSSWFYFDRTEYFDEVIWADHRSLVQVERCSKGWLYHLSVSEEVNKQNRKRKLERWEAVGCGLTDRNQLRWLDHLYSQLLLVRLIDTRANQWLRPKVGF